MSLPCPFTLSRGSHCWRPGLGEPCLTCCVCYFMLCKLLVFRGSDLLRDNSTADGVSSDLQLFCVSKSSLSSKPGSIIDEIPKDSDAFRSTHMKWDHYIQGSLGFLGTKKIARVIFGVCFVRWEHRIKLAWMCPVLGPPQACPTDSTSLLYHWRNWGGAGRVVWEIAALKRHSLHQLCRMDEGCQRRACWKRKVCRGWFTCKVCLPLLPLSSPNLL